MGLVSIAAFRAHPGKEAELRRVIADRLPLLRGLGLATDRPDILLRSRGSTGAKGGEVLVSISEWVSQEAIDRAHRMPEVHALWGRFAACSDWVKLETLPECGEDFATFEAV